MIYDAAILGAGADGLAAAALLARAGLKAVVIERAAHAGGRCVTCEFEPGFFASPYTDTVSPVPAALVPLLGLGDLGFDSFAPYGHDIAQRRKAALRRVLAEAAAPAPKDFLARCKARLTEKALRPWPASDWAARSIADLRPSQNDWRTALAGRAADPALAGSALSLFAAPQMRLRQGGLGTLGAAFETAARRAGAEIRFGQEAGEIRRDTKNSLAVILGDGTALTARAVISTLDFKRTVLSLFRWAELPGALVADAGAWRAQGARARLLLALAAPPSFRRPFFVPGSADMHAALRHGLIPASPPMLVDPVSLHDSTLAPRGASVVTVTLGCVPQRLFDGGWTHRKREDILQRALAVLETRGPLPPLRAAATIVPPDIEAALGLSGGDLDGGALAPDQMLGFRPGPRTPVRHLYLAGPSSAAGPLGTAAAGVAAAVALLADRA